MTPLRIRVAIGLLTGFIALTAVGGGIAILVGAEQARFPLDWLRDTPFSDYTIPALLLSIVVGGSSLVAAVAVFTNRAIAPVLAIFAGLMMAGFIVVEVAILKQVPPGPTPMEIFYFTLGAIILGLGIYARRPAAQTTRAA